MEYSCPLWMRIFAIIGILSTWVAAIVVLLSILQGIRIEREFNDRPRL